MYIVPKVKKVKNINWYKPHVGHNANRDNAEENEEQEADSPELGSGRKSKTGLSESFSAEDLVSLAREGDEALPPRDLEDAISVESESTSDIESSQNAKHNAQRNGFFHILRKGPMRTFPIKGVHILTRRKSKRMRGTAIPPSECFDGELCYFKPHWKNFSQAEMQYATNNYSRDNLIGEGGYAQVYKGKLKDGEIVAIKRLTRGSSEDMAADFLSELGIMVHIDHPNIAKVIGYGVDGGMHVVLHLSPHGSLASLLYGAKEKLVWEIRYKIVVGTAEGLQYLHEGCQRRIIHRDIKAANILLEEDLSPMISDFGLSKWLPDQWTHHTVSNIEGTFGYLPPEFFMHGIVDEKTDVYAYGVLLLELITGRQALDNKQQSLVLWAKPLLNTRSMNELVDPDLTDYNKEKMEITILVASMCLHQSSVQRPLMAEIVQIFKGDETTLDRLKLRQKSKLQRTYSVELLDAEEYNSTKYLSDMDRHLKMILDDD